MVWLFWCLLVAVVYPIIDGRKVLWKATRLAWTAMTEKRSKNFVDGNQYQDYSSEHTPQKTPSETVKAG